MELPKQPRVLSILFGAGATVTDERHYVICLSLLPLVRIKVLSDRDWARVGLPWASL